jgi:hypothetical protein
MLRVLILLYPDTAASCERSEFLLFANTRTATLQCNTVSVDEQVTVAAAEASAFKQLELDLDDNNSSDGNALTASDETVLVKRERHLMEGISDVLDVLIALTIRDMAKVSSDIVCVHVTAL